MAPETFAQDWAAAWNSHDLSRILSHYADTIIFRSRKAIPLTGKGEIVGHPALRTYWKAALDAQPDLHFTVTEVYQGHQMLTIAYTNQRQVKAMETLWFDELGIVIQAAACHAI